MGDGTSVVGGWCGESWFGLCLAGACPSGSALTVTCLHHPCSPLSLSTLSFSHLLPANLAVIGSVAYYTYANWHKPRWDRRVVSATVIAVSAWFGLQGYAQLAAIE